MKKRGQELVYIRGVAKKRVSNLPTDDDTAANVRQERTGHRQSLVGKRSTRVHETCLTDMMNTRNMSESSWRTDRSGRQ